MAPYYPPYQQPPTHPPNQPQYPQQSQRPQFPDDPQFHQNFTHHFVQNQQYSQQYPQQQFQQPPKSHSYHIPQHQGQAYLHGTDQVQQFYAQPQIPLEQQSNGSIAQQIPFYGQPQGLGQVPYPNHYEQAQRQQQYQLYTPSPPTPLPQSLPQQSYVHSVPHQYSHPSLQRTVLSPVQQHTPHPLPQHHINQQSPKNSLSNQSMNTKHQSKPPVSVTAMGIPSQTVNTPPTPATRVLQDVQPNAMKPQTTKPTLTADPEPAEPNYAVVLLTMADEYLEASKKLRQRDESYYKLVATSLGCMESVLKNFNLTPAREAQISLRYAQLLYSETTNYDEAETVLTKAIDLCQRMKLLDLKYAMQLLLAKILFQSKPKAAIRDLQGMITDLEAYHHTAWEYAFRFQHVAFSMNSSLNIDVPSALANLEKIQHTSRQYGDHAIFAFAAIMESLLHLHISGSEALSLAQSALAKARSLQLNPDVEKALQLSVLAEFIDLYCCTQTYDYARIEEKRKSLQDTLYKAIESKDWNSQGLIILPLSTRSLQNIAIQSGTFIFEEKGRHYMAFSWLDTDEVEAVAFLLCGDSIAYKYNENGNTKAERYMIEGMRIPQEIISKAQPCSGKDEMLQFRWRVLIIHFLLQAAFLQSSRGQWVKASNAMREIEVWMKGMTRKLPAEIEASVAYLRGVTMQGIGNTEEALKIFQSPPLDISQLNPRDQTSGRPTRNSHNKNDEVLKHFAMLAAMNSALIVHLQSHAQHYLLQNLINSLSPLVQNSHNKSLQTSYSFLLAVLPNTSILRTKQYLNVALRTAKEINDHQIVGLTLTVMHEKFFKGVVPDEQAIKCARAATHQVKTRWGDPMWLAVATGLEADCLAMSGDQTEAANKRVEAARAMSMVPEPIKQASA